MNDGTAAPTAHFAFELTPSYRPAARLFGVRPATAGVTVTGTELIARFGPWTVRTPLANITASEPTGPFAFVKTAGPARLAVTDRGLTFATTGRQGLLLTFAEHVRGIDPWGLIRHPELTVTVRDPEALAAALTAGRTAAARTAGRRA